MKAVCSKGAKSEIKFTEKAECSASAEFTGQEACSLYSVDPQQYLGVIAPFMGLIILAIGLLMLFLGAKFLFQAFASLIALFVTVSLFTVCYKLVQPGNDDKSLYIMGSLLVVCVIIGGYSAYFSYRFSKEWVVTLVAAWGGLIVALLLVKLFSTGNATVSLFTGFTGAFIAGYLGSKLDKIVRVFGTSAIGAFMVVKGIGFYLADSPDVDQIFDQIKQGNLIFTYDVYGYLFGMIVLFLLGTRYQLKLFKGEEMDEDAYDYMAHDDDSGQCVCL